MKGPGTIMVGFFDKVITDLAIVYNLAPALILWTTAEV
jgi:hypothetical protein